MARRPSAAEFTEVRGLLAEHVEHTSSRQGRWLLNNLQRELESFWVLAASRVDVPLRQVESLPAAPAPG